VPKGVGGRLESGRHVRILEVGGHEDSLEADMLHVDSVMESADDLDGGNRRWHKVELRMELEASSWEPKHNRVERQAECTGNPLGGQPEHMVIRPWALLLLGECSTIHLRWILGTCSSVDEYGEGRGRSKVVGARLRSVTSVRSS
jgi:hypothetical protein